MRCLFVEFRYPAKLAGTPWSPAQLGWRPRRPLPGLGTLPGTRLTWPASLTAPSGAGNLAWYPANFPAPGWGLDFLLPPFLVSRQEKEVSREEKEM